MPFDSFWKLQVGVRGQGDLLDGLALVRVAPDEPAALLPFQVVGRDLEHRRGDDAGPLADLAGHHSRGGTGDRCGAGAIGAKAERRLVGVSMHHLDVVRGDAELFCHDLGERRLVALPLRLHRDSQHGLAGRMHPQLRAVGHAKAKNVHVLTRPCSNRLGEEADADTHERTWRRLLATLRRLLPPRRLLAPQLVVAGHLHRLAQRPRIVTRVVFPAGRALIRELLRAQQAA